MLLAQKIGYQGMHTGSGKKYRRVVFGDQGFPLDLGMSFDLKKFDRF
jgi:hypothetical protein